jgi:hypothetical protein
MAGTYFKYAERNVDSQINWAEIGKNMVNMLQEEDRLREEKKAAIDEASREFSETLANAPTGDFTSANEWTLRYSSDASEALLMQDRLLKNGLLKPKDYIIMRQNLTDGTNQMFQVAKEYQQKASEIMKGYESGQLQETSAWLMEQIEGLSNFKNTKAYINPTNFSVSLGMMKKKIIDGKEVMVMETDPDKFMTINQLRNYINVKLDKYNYVSDVEKMVSSLGENQISDISKLTGFYKVGSIKEITDPTMRERLSDEDEKTVSAYVEWENNTIKSQLANPYNHLSLLTDAIDKVPGTQDYYEPTFDDELSKTNPKYILLENDGSGVIKPKFTPEQEKVATDFLRAQTRNALDRKTTQRTFTEPQPPQPTQWQYQESREQDRQATVGNMIGKAFGGKNADVEAAMDYIQAYPGVNKIDRQVNSLIITKDGVEKTFSIKAGGLNNFIGAVGKFLEPNVDINALRRGSDAGDFGTPSTHTAQREAQQKNIEKDFAEFVSLKFNATTLAGYKGNEDPAVEYFNGILAGIPGLEGYKATDNNRFSSGVIIRDEKNKQVAEFDFDNVTAKKAQDYINTIINLAANRASIEQKFSATKRELNTK